MSSCYVPTLTLPAVDVVAIALGTAYARVVQYVDMRQLWNQLGSITYEFNAQGFRNGDRGASEFSKRGLQFTGEGGIGGDDGGFAGH